MVPLDPDSLLRASAEATGLEDYGDDWFRLPLGLLCESLDGEAKLHLAGRVRARCELQLLLQNRLRLVHLWIERPEIAEQRVHAPIVVTGLGRSGTTLLHELLACDPANRAPLLWELVYTVPTPEAPGAQLPSDLIHAEVTLMDEMVPAFTSMHENGGALPTECIFAFAHQFSTDMFTGLYNVPDYTIWHSTSDRRPEYEWHQKMLQTLQWRTPTHRWVVKAPSHLSSLALLFDTYPDARVVITHRDPLRVMGSLADTMSTLHWMHSDHVDHETMMQFLCMGLELQMDSVTAERDSGVLPSDQISDVNYLDLVKDPKNVVVKLYKGWDLPVTNEFSRGLDGYLRKRHEGRSSPHEYRFEETGLDLQEHRALLARYQQRFGVASEV